MGKSDIGLAMTLQNCNAPELIRVYRITEVLGVEFATNVVCNAQYFRKFDNRIERPRRLARELEKLVRLQLRSSLPKSWFRAYFNYGLIRRLRGEPRPLPCTMGSGGGFVTAPDGNVLPCNSMIEKVVMGNLKRQSWDEIWTGSHAEEARRRVASCTVPCWSIGNAAPAIWQHPLPVLRWVVRQKLSESWKAPAAD
jgi:MoaA/NifB/PqqE/SkfB family radical SAM enzyme